MQIQERKTVRVIELLLVNNFLLLSLYAQSGNIAGTVTDSSKGVNHQGEYILAIGGDLTTDNWLDHRVEVDFSGSQQINKHES